MGRERHRPPRTAVDDDRIVRLYRQGLLVSVISQRTGYAVATIVKVLAAAGITAEVRVRS